MLSFSRLFATALLTLALSAGQAGLCAGWMSTPEARMACCSDDGACPMHTSDSDHHGTTRSVTQAEADSCCTASGQDEPAPSPANAAFFITLAVALSPVQALLPQSERHLVMSRASVPAPGAHVPKHVLLSVFLV